VFTPGRDDSPAAPWIAAEIEVSAPRDVVWAVLTDIDAWPSWNPDVKSASLEGALAEGTRFRWKAGPGTITSTLRQIEPPRLIAWSGKTFGINAVHVHRLDERDGTTAVTSEESWDGLLVRLLRRRLAKTLDESIRSGLQHLKAEAERRSTPRPA
jgi:uncharacterized protein YndB with AHSA1/START domain